jgi:DNA-binding Lrp family transcriptional regulator
MLNVKTGTEDDICKKLVELNEVEEVASIYGEYDAIIKVKVNDMKHLDHFIIDDLRRIENILITATMIISKEYR